jgi:hypothetical protein
MLAGGLMASLPGLAVAGAVGLGVGAVAGLGYLGYRAYKHFSRKPARRNYGALADVPAAAARAPDHAANRDEFYRLRDNASGGDEGARHSRALHHAAAAYGFDTDHPDRSYRLHSAPMAKDTTHATTRGGHGHSEFQVVPEPMTVTFHRDYIGRAAATPAARDRHYANVVHTLMHEHAHVRQHADMDHMRTTSRPMREFDAYSAEVLHDQNLPPLHPKDRQRKVRKALENLERAQDTDEYRQMGSAQRADYEARAERLRKLRGERS